MLNFFSGSFVALEIWMELKKKSCWLRIFTLPLCNDDDSGSQTTNSSWRYQILSDEDALNIIAFIYTNAA